MDEQTRRAILTTVAFILLCLSMLLLLFHSASAAWQVEKEFPPGFFNPTSEESPRESELFKPDESRPMEEENVPEPEGLPDSEETDTEIPPYFEGPPESDEGLAFEGMAEPEEAPEDFTLGASGFPPPGYSIPDGPSGPSGDAQAVLLEDIRAIRTDISLFLYGFLPLAIAVLVLYKFCIWFYRTFIASAF